MRSKRPSDLYQDPAQDLPQDPPCSRAGDRSLSASTHLQTVQSALFSGDAQQINDSLHQAECFLKELPIDTDATLRIELSGNLAQLMDQAGRGERAVPLYLENLDFLQQHGGSTEEIVRNMINLAVCYQNLGDHTIGWHVLDRAEILSRRIITDPLRGLCCYNMALREGRIFGDFGRATELLEEALLIFEEGDPYGTLHLALLVGAKNALDQGGLQEAYQLAGKAAWAAQVLDDQDSLAEATALQASTLRRRQMRTKAARLLEDARGIAPQNIFVMFETVESLFDEQRYEEAFETCQMAIRESKKRQLPWSEMLCHYWFALLYGKFEVGRMEQFHIDESHRIAMHFVSQLDAEHRSRFAEHNPDYKRVLELMERRRSE